MSLPTVAITVNLYDGTGAPLTAGAAIFTPTGDVTVNSGLQEITPAPVTVQMTGGLPSASILPTDIAGSSPSGWAWQAAFPGVPGQPPAFTFRCPAGPVAFTAAVGTPGVVTWTPTAALTSLPPGTGVQFVSGAPAGTSNATTYYVTSSSGSTSQISATLGGSPLAFTGTGSGQLAVVSYLLSALTPLSTMPALSQLMGVPTGVAAAGTVPVATGTAENTAWKYGPGLVFDIRDFGAVGDDSTDDTTAIQAAVNAAVAFGGGTVYIPPQNFVVSAPVHAGGGSPGGLVIAGAGWNSQITLKSGSNCYAFDFGGGAGTYTAGLIMRDFYIQANAAGQTTGGGGIDAHGAVRCRFERLWIDSPAGDGLLLRENGSSGFGQHNVIFGCAFTNGRNAPGTCTGYAVRTVSTDENLFLGCVFQDNGNPASANPCQVYETAGLQYFQNCSFVGGPASGVLNATLKLQGPNTNVVNCTFDGCNGSPMVRLNGDNCLISASRFYNIGFGAASSGAAVPGVLIDNANGSQVTGSMFQPAASGSGYADSGVQMQGSGSDNLISGNQFNLHGTTGTWVHGPVHNTSSGTGNAIRGNKGANPGSVTTPAFPATTVTYSNNTGYEVTAYVTNGAGTMTTTVNGSAGPSLAANAQLAITLAPSATFVPAYGTGAPAWVLVAN